MVRLHFHYVLCTLSALSFYLDANLTEPVTARHQGSTLISA